MTSRLYRAMQADGLSPLAYFFARFLADKYQRDEDGTLALSAALVSERNQQGDVCVDLRRHAGTALFNSDTGQSQEVPRAPELTQWLHELATDAAVGRPGEFAPLILDDERLYLHRLWQFEQQLLTSVQARLESPPVLDETRLASGLTRLFPASGNDLDWQKLASALAVSQRFAVISGGPGTGKTTTVVKVLALLLEQCPDMHIRLAAPTGKAAARMVDAIRQRKAGIDVADELRARIPDQATTLHRLLGFNGRHFSHHRRNPLVLDCLVVDEASMIDLPMMARLLTALPDNARIILLGDRDQLASVEAGNVLGDITGHGQPICYSTAQGQFLATLTGTPMAALPVSDTTPPIADAIGLLRTSYRFDAGSGIGQLARRVNEGEGEAALSLLRDDPSAQLIWHENNEKTISSDALAWAVTQYVTYLHCDEIGAALDAFEQIRVLCALRSGPFGVDEVNRIIAERLRARGLIEAGEEYHGKPVMVTVNDYEVALYNGDIGLLWRNARGELRAWFRTADGQLRDIPLHSLPEHVPAWGLTVHKSQGSEFERVLLVLPSETVNPLLNRELIYTGITRARRQLHISASAPTLLQGCRERVRRSSGLAQKLVWCNV
ncbi:MAG TPA: exodeoxyribonuclease V subunit alpha [Gammaproteobacteria bacterium]|nr:exodeoxyribonuclease V subunit alpha [Gammaproteobacteria bacterium]